MAIQRKHFSHSSNTYRTVTKEVDTGFFTVSKKTRTFDERVPYSEWLEETLKAINDIKESGATIITINEFTSSGQFRGDDDKDNIIVYYEKI